MRAIPLGLRQHIMELYGQGRTTREIAISLDFCVAAVRRVRQQYKERGTLQPETSRCGRKTLFTAGRKVRLRWLVGENPDATLEELGKQMDRPFPPSTIDLWLRQLGLTRDLRRQAAGERSKQPVTDGRQDIVRGDWCLWDESKNG